jgi:hypothetical protein
MAGVLGTTPTDPHLTPPSEPARSTLRAVLAVLLLPVLTSLFVAAGTGTAHAADGYKYWNYFHVKGDSFVFATTGPGGYKPANGSVEAYRYGLSSTASGLPPRTDAKTYSIDKICAGTKASTGQKRVGVLIDYGTKQDAAAGETPPKPQGRCAVVPASANGQQVLDAVTDVRIEKNLVCGINGYPVTTCSVTVKNPPKAATAANVSFVMPASAKGATTSPSTTNGESDQGGINWPIVVVILVVVLLVAAALLLLRRNRTT